MPVKVKICGVRTPAIVDVAVEAGADYVGLVFFPRSPRHLELEAAQPLAEAALGRIDTVAVLVDPDDALIDRVIDHGSTPICFSFTAARRQSGSPRSGRALACRS